MNAFQVSMNSDSLDHALADFQSSLAGDSPALAAIADDLREILAEQFSTEGAAGGSPWAPLAPSTLRKAHAARVGILQVTGALAASLVDKDAPGHVEECDGEQLLFGTGLPYAVFHQEGTRRMPARPIVALAEESTARWLDAFRGGLEEKTTLLGASELGGKEIVNGEW